MTGTADTEAAEFHQIYKLDVVVIPTNRAMIRADHQDVVYASEREKYEAVADEIVAAHERASRSSSARSRSRNPSASRTC